MPPAIPIIAVAAGSLLGGIAAGLGPVGIALSVGLTTSLAVAQTLLAPKPKRSNQADLAARSQGQTITQRTSVGIWRIIYGEQRVGLHPVYIGPPL